MRHLVALAVLICLNSGVAVAQDRDERQQTEAQDAGLSDKDPQLLSFDDLVTLSSAVEPEAALSARLDSLLATPFLHNDAAAAHIQPRRHMVANLGPVLRVGFWNIERGLNFELISSALGDPAEFRRLAGPARPGSDRGAGIADAQLRSLQDVDVLVLNEVDLGMKRTQYRDVARELAAALHMNYVYGVEFVELDPIFDLGIEGIHLSDPQEDARLQEDLQVDRQSYKGLHGTAILSRYPIKRARIFRLPVCYDWFSQEAQKISLLEKGRRWSAQKLFREQIGREVRRGGRMAIIADLAVPDLPTGEATVVATHLENKCAPQCRKKQMQALLAELKPITNPVVVAGDLNSTGKTNTPTSIRNEIMTRVTDYQFWIKQAVSYFHPLGIFKLALIPVHYLHGYMDPTALHIPILWENNERGLFEVVENFRFADKDAFDFRGLPDHTLPPRKRTLADSNQRASKGFVPTYAFNRDFRGVGRFKLDWIFIKPFIQHPRSKDLQNNSESDWFAPHFPATLRELNESVSGRISDHAPMTVDLPLRNPAALAGSATQDHKDP